MLLLRHRVIPNGWRLSSDSSGAYTPYCEVNQEEDCCLEEPTCDFGSLVEELEMSKSSLSLHLKELRHAGLVETIKDGRQVTIQINPEKVEELRNFFDLAIDRHTRNRMNELAGKGF